MKSKNVRFSSVDEYVSTFPEETQKALEEIRAVIKAVVPGAEEHISYNMPAFKVNGEFFAGVAAWKNHIGMYPIPEGNAAFQKEVLKYKGAKSSLRFPLNEPMPLKFIGKTVKFRVAENLKNSRIKSGKKY